MKLYFDLGKQRILSVPRGGEVGLIHLKAGGAVALEIDFYNGKASTAPAFTPLIQFAIKTSEEGTLLALADTGDFSGSGAFYGGTLLTNTAEMVAWLAGASSKLAVAELTIRDGEEGIPIRSQTLVVRVANHVIRGDEGTPGSLPDPLAWLAANGIVYDPAITGLTGGGASKLDGIATEEVPAGRLQALAFNTAVYVYKLTAATSAEFSPDTIRPDDYQAGTNEKVWQLQGMQAKAGFFESLNVGRGNALTGAVSFARDDSNFQSSLRTAALTADREIDLPDRDGKVAVGFPEYADLAAANAGEASIGRVFFNLSTSKYEVTTDTV